MNTMKLLVAGGLLALAGACTSGSNNNNSTPTPAPAPSNCTKAGECAGLGSGGVAVPCCPEAKNYSLVTDPQGKCGSGLVGQSTMRCVLNGCTEKGNCLPVVPGAACCSGTTEKADTTCTMPAGATSPVIGVQDKRCE